MAVQIAGKLSKWPRTAVTTSLSLEGFSACIYGLLCDERRVLLDQATSYCAAVMQAVVSTAPPGQGINSDGVAFTCKITD